MKISQKIALGFGLFTFFVAFVSYLNYRSFFKERDISQKINTIYTPSLRLLEELDRSVGKTQLCIKHISYYETLRNDPNRRELKELLETTLPNQLYELDTISKFWQFEEVVKKEIVKNDITEFAAGCWDIVTLLPDLNSYTDPDVMMNVKEQYLLGMPMAHLPPKIRQNVKDLINTHHNFIEDANDQLSLGANERNRKALILLGGVILIGILITLFVIRSIIQPINQLREMVLYLGKGKYPKSSTKISKDEIGEMAVAVNNLVSGLKKTKEFSLEIGKGNFDLKYEPLSMEDELGHALLKMRSELVNSERILEHKVEERTSQMEMERERATKLYQDLNDSIEYAKRIQTSFLSDKNKVTNMFEDSFIMYKPKDKVSGDFFWGKNMGDKSLVAAVDCTGHGVPGAFVSMVGNNVLNQISKVYTNPASILNNLHTISSRILKKGREDEPLRDGMDISLCLIDKKQMKLEFAGAYNPAYIIRDEKLFQLKGDRFAIGSNQAHLKSYACQSFDLQKGDVIYLFSDGYADQFGGPKNKKYLIKSFRQKLISISKLDLTTQEQMLEEEHATWKGTCEQVDDILVMGFRV